MINWPIQVGGVYAAVSQPGCKREVLSTDEEQVLFQFHGSTGAIDAMPRSVSVGVFREISIPGDQSPIPQLVAALKGMIELEEGDAHTPGMRFLFIRNAQAALLAAEGRQA